jgi:hypothetical protein
MRTMCLVSHGAPPFNIKGGILSPLTGASAQTAIASHPANSNQIQRYTASDKSDCRNSFGHIPLYSRNFDIYLSLVTNLSMEK